MACRAPPLWCSIIFIVLGIIIAVLAVLPWFLIPNAVEDAVTETAVLTDEKDEGFKEFKDQTKNPLIFNCYFWNITNPAGVRAGQKPVMASVGPYVWKKYAHRINITFSSDKNTFQYREWNEYIYDPVLSGGRNASGDLIWTVNTAWVAGVPTAINEGFVGATATYSALFGLKSSFAENILVTIQFLNSAWATAIRTGFTVNLGGNLAFLAGAYSTNSSSWPFNERTGVFAEILEEGNVTTFNRLFDPAVTGSLMDTNSGAPDLWLTCASPVLYAGDLSPSQIQRICAWRSILRAPGVFKRIEDNGGEGYLATVGGLGTTLLLNFLPTPYAGDPALVENNLNLVHFIRHLPGVAGIFPGNASIINLNPLAAGLLQNTRPELGHFAAFDAATYIMGVEFAASPPSLPNLQVLTQPAAFTADHARWIFTTLASNATVPGLPPTARLGAVTIAAIITGIPLFLQTHPLYGTLYNSRDFTTLASVWNATTFPAQFEAGINNAIAGGLVKGFPAGTGTLLRSIGLFPASPSFTFQQVFQVYLWLKYQWVGAVFVPRTIAATGSGLIIQVTPQETMFGRTERFFSRAVPGIWTDFTLELGVQNNKIETYMTGNDDVKNFRKQLTYNGNSSLAQYFPLLTPAPTVQGSSLTFIGPYRLISKNGIKKAEDEKLLLWVPDVVRELQLVYQSETSLLGIDLYRFEANAQYKSVVKSEVYRNPFDFVMENSLKYNGGTFPFYLTFPGFTLVKDVEEFNGRVDGVTQDEKNWILTWDFEPITGLAMRASAPLQLSLPLGIPTFPEIFNTYSRGAANATIPAWYIIRTNQITQEQADDWKEAVGGALAVQLGLTAAMAVIGGVLFVIGVALLIWRLVAGKSGEMTEFELRN